MVSVRPSAPSPHWRGFLLSKRGAVSLLGHFPTRRVSSRKGRMRSRKYWCGQSAESACLLVRFFFFFVSAKRAHQQTLLGIANARMQSTSRGSRRRRRERVLQSAPLHSLSFSPCYLSPFHSQVAFPFHRRAFTPRLSFFPYYLWSVAHRNAIFHRSHWPHTQIKVLLSDGPRARGSRARSARTDRTGTTSFARLSDCSDRRDKWTSDEERSFKR